MFFTSLSQAQGRLPQKSNRLLEYFAQATTFKEELVVLYHLLARAPSRGIEVLSIPFRNGLDRTPYRGIFILQGYIELVTSYYKGASYKGSNNIIYRFMPPKVGKVLITFLQAVVPFLDILKELQAQELGQALLKPPYQIQELRPKLATLEDRDDFKARGARAQDLSSRGESSKGKGSQDRESQDKEGGSRSASRAPSLGQPFKHQKRKQAPSYSNIDRFQDTNRLKRVIRREQIKRVKVVVTPSQQRQVFPAILKAYSQDQTTIKMLDRLYNNKHRAAQQEQSSYTKSIKEGIYKVRTNKNPFSTFSNQQRFL